MTYKGHVQNGVVVLDESAALKDGVRVRIEVLDESDAEPLHPDIKRFIGVLLSDINAHEEYAEGMVKKHA